MPEVEQSIWIHQPVEHVFKFVADFENYPQWNHNILDCKRNEESSTDIGTTFNSRMVYMGRKYSATLEITEYEINKRITFHVNQFWFFKWFKGIFRFEPFSRSTKVTITTDVDLITPFKPMLLVMPVLGRQSWRKHLSELKRVLESGKNDTNP